jgi:hypothetical protein
LQPAESDPPAIGRLTSVQREALWTWTWLGWRGSTPAFKGSLALAVSALIGIIVYRVATL